MEPVGEPPSTLAPDTGKPDQGPWYRRRGVLLGVCVAVVLVITVITDLPSHASRATNIASSNAVIKEVNADISPCVFGANEAFTIYGYQVHNSLTASDRAQMPALLNDDLTACSFTNDSIFSLSDIEVPGSSAGKQLGNIVSSVTLWTTSDALGAVVAIQRLTLDPTNAAALATLARDRRQLASDRTAADASLQAIETMLDTKLLPLDLPQIPTSSDLNGVQSLDQA